LLKNFDKVRLAQKAKRHLLIFPSRFLTQRRYTKPGLRCASIVFNDK
jgi:hypothetical protein